VARGWRAAYPFTVGEFIRDYLLKRGEAYIHEAWRAFKEDLRARGLRWWGSYSSFRMHFYILLRLGLVRRVRRGPAGRPHLIDRSYYEAVPENLDVDVAWRNPRAVLYPASVYGGRLYREKAAEAARLGVSVSELALSEHPELREARRRLGLE